MSKTSKIKIRVLKAVTFLLLFVLLASSALLFLHFFDKQQGNFTSQSIEDFGTKIQYDGRSYVLKENIQTLLIMGLDKYDGAVDNSGYNNNQQADFVILLVFDNDSSKCSAIQINRDAMTEINILGVAGEKVGTVTKQIALAHTYGNGREVSCRNVANAASKLLLNTKIDHYMSLTMDSVATVNDAVGGVEVKVLDDFVGIDDSLIMGETVTLQGEQALRYVRSRYGMDDSTNSNRMIRQRQYLKALYTKFLQKSENNETFIAETSVKMADYLVSDCSVNQLERMFQKFSTYEFTDIYPLEGEYKVGEEFMEFYADEDSVKKTVIDLFYEPKD